MYTIVTCTNVDISNDISNEFCQCNIINHRYIITLFLLCVENAMFICMNCVSTSM